MIAPIGTGSVHHVRLTVSEVARSQAFSTEVRGFHHVMDLPAGGFLSKGTVGLGRGPSPDPSRASATTGSPPCWSALLEITPPMRRAELTGRTGAESGGTPAGADEGRSEPAKRASPHRRARNRRR